MERNEGTRTMAQPTIKLQLVNGVWSRLMPEGYWSTVPIPAGWGFGYGPGYYTPPYYTVGRCGG